MKVTRFLLFILTIATLLLSACGGTAATPNPGAGKVEPIPVAFVGTVESIAGDQWVINGQTVTVAPDVIRDGPFNVGDQVKVEGVVNADGSFGVSRVEAPTPEDASALPPFGNENSNVNDANTNDVNANSNDANANDDNSNSVNINDDNGNDANSNDDNSNSANINDDNGNDDNGNDANSNDDNGGNDNSDDSNANDDNSNSGGGDDNGSGNNDNGGGNDDNGGGGSNDDNGNGG